MILNLSFEYFYWRKSVLISMATIKWIFHILELFFLLFQSVIFLKFHILLTLLLWFPWVGRNMSMFILVRNSTEQMCVLSRLKWTEILSYSFYNALCDLFRENPICSWLNLVTEYFLLSHYDFQWTPSSCGMRFIS